jgi:hypothetical protein
MHLITQSRDYCFQRCDSSKFCAGAVYTETETVVINCKLVIYGFEKVNEFGSVSYIRPEALLDMENEADPKHPADSKFFPNGFLIRKVSFEKPFKSSMSLSPTACFQSCQNTTTCVAATFQPISNDFLNCYFHSDSVVDRKSLQTSIAFVKHNKADYAKTVVASWLPSFILKRNIQFINFGYFP